MLCFIISRKVKMQLKRKKRLVQCMEKVLWLIKCVKSGLRSFLVLLTFWPNNSLLWGYLTHWPGWPLPVGSQSQEIADILKISKSMKLLVKMKSVSFILWKKRNGLFGQPNVYLWLPAHLRWCLWLWERGVA